MVWTLVRRSTRVWHVLWCTAVCAISIAAASYANPRCDRTLCYFCGNDNGVQWRIYDPTAGIDTLLLSLPGEASVRWDSSRTHAEYCVGGDLFEVAWRLGAHPKRIARLPHLPAIEDWWFNPDSLRWQVWTMEPLAETPTRPAYRDCDCELWQSSRNGERWHRMIADTVDCAAWFEGSPPPPVPPRIAALRARGVPMVTSADLTDDLSPESPGAEWIGSSSDSCEFPLYYVPSRSVKGRGISFRYGDAAPEPDRAVQPVHWVDRDHGARVLLCGPDSCPSEITGVTISEECGLLLVCDYHTTRLIDVATGHDVRLAGSAAGLRHDGLLLGIDAFWGPVLAR